MKQNKLRLKEKNSDIVKNLLDTKRHENRQEFLFYAQNKMSRASYLKAKRKKKNTMSSISHMKNLLSQYRNNSGLQKQFYKILSQGGVNGIQDGKNSSPLQALANMDMNINVLNGINSMGGMNNRLGGVGMTQPPLSKAFNNNAAQQYLKRWKPTKLQA